MEDGVDGMEAVECGEHLELVAVVCDERFALCVVKAPHRRCDTRERHGITWHDATNVAGALSV